jgi:hypothetical protein
MSEDTKFKGVTITPDEKNFVVNVEGHSFTFTMPNPYQKTKILAATASALEGNSKEAVGEEGYEYVRMVVTLNSVITKKPAWWKAADQCPSDDFLFKLWREYIKAEDEFAGRLLQVADSKEVGKG